MDYDFIVIGAGSAGFSAATYARGLGKRVAIVECHEDLGGLCILRGCMPAKTVLRSAEIAEEVKKAPDFGIKPRDLKIDVKAIVRRKNRVIREFAKERIEAIESFPLYRGDCAAFIAPDAIDIDGTVLRAQRFLISTGSKIVEPQIAGLSQCGYITSDDALEMKQLPRSVLILGGGPVGCEFAQYFSRLDVKVTLLQDHSTLLRHEDDDVGKTVAEALRDDGVEVVTNVSFAGASTCDGAKAVTVRTTGGMQTFEAAEIFVATNRVPNVARLALDKANVAIVADAIAVNDYLQTSNPRVYAAGDVIGHRMLVHLAEHGGRIAAHNAFTDRPLRVNFDLHEARSVYTQPEVAVAGLNEKQCQARGIEYVVASYQFKDHGKAITMDTPEGFVKMLAAKDGTILGFTIVGGDAADYLHESLASLYFRAKVTDIPSMPHLHPTMAEIITYPAEELANRLGVAPEAYVAG